MVPLKNYKLVNFKEFDFLFGEDFKIRELQTERLSSFLADRDRNVERSKEREKGIEGEGEKNELRSELVLFENAS